MTLTVGIIAKDGIVMASDSRIGSDLYSNDNADKIIKLNECTAIGIAGDGTLATHILDIVTTSETLDLDSGIQQTAEFLSKELAVFFDKYYPNVPFKERVSLDIILGGYSLDFKPHIYNLCSEDNFIPRQSPAGFCSVGYPHIANYHLNRIYEKEKMYASEAAKLSVFCIKETSSQYKSVGGEIRVAIFSNTKNFQLISQIDISKLESQCEALQQYHKYRFYPEEQPEGLSDPDEDKLSA